jgi:hypothetical protein
MLLVYSLSIESRCAAERELGPARLLHRILRELNESPWPAVSG